MSSHGNGFATLLQDAAINRAFDRQEKAAYQDCLDWSRACERAESRANKAERQLWGVLGLHGALSACLVREIPSHPMVTDNVLRDKVFAAGKRAGEEGGDFNAVNRAGEKFAMPAAVMDLGGRAFRLDRQLHELTWKYDEAMAKFLAKSGEAFDLRNENSALKARIAELEASQISSEAAANGLRQTVADREKTIKRMSDDPAVWALIKDCATHMSLHYAFREALRGADSNHVLLRDSTLRGRIARQAYERLRTDPKQDWAVVREVGMTWGMPKASVDFVEDAPADDAVGQDEHSSSSLSDPHLTQEPNDHSVPEESVAIDMDLGREQEADGAGGEQREDRTEEICEA